LRTIFLIGNYAHGGYAPDSDIDMCFVFRGDRDTEGDPGRKLWSLVEHLVRMSSYKVDPMYKDVESYLYTRTIWTTARAGRPPGDEGAQSAALGEDIRPRIALCEDREIVLRDVLAAPLNWAKSATAEGRTALCPTTRSLCCR